MPTVFMRTKTGDCTVAAIATAAGRSYETIAAALGIDLDPAGRPVDRRSWPASDCCETAILLCERLAAAGLEFVPFVTSPLFPPHDLKAALADVPSPCVLFIESSNPADGGLAHAVVYSNGEIIDCRPGSPSIEIERVTVFAALVPMAGEH